ncbi:MAG: hypothetical protein ABIU95_07110 [Burkholderiales bacterium]
MKLDIQPTGAPHDLLASDAKQPENRILEHPIWAAALTGDLPKARLKALLLAIYPAVAGPGRYAFAAKVSQIDAQDGKTLFLALYDALKKPEADADAGWRRVLLALGATAKEVDAALAAPSAEAEDFVEVIKMHGLRSGAVEAACISHSLEQHFPVLWGRLADALSRRYGVPAAALGYLRYEASRAAAVTKWTKHLVDRYVGTADPYEIFEGRRAAREAVWAWTVLTESAP